MNEYPQQLSGGEKIRVSILLAMLHQPEILVFDEPTASLDKHHTQIIVELLKEYAHQGHIVIIFTHDNFMKNEADVIYQIDNHTLIKANFLSYLGIIVLAIVVIVLILLIIRAINLRKRRRRRRNIF